MMRISCFFLCIFSASPPTFTAIPNNNNNHNAFRPSVNKFLIFICLSVPALYYNVDTNNPPKKEKAGHTQKKKIRNLMKQNAIILMTIHTNTHTHTPTTTSKTIIRRHDNENKWWFCSSSKFPNSLDCLLGLSKVFCECVCIINMKNMIIIFFGGKYFSFLFFFVFLHAMAWHSHWLQYVCLFFWKWSILFLV